MDGFDPSEGDPGEVSGEDSQRSTSEMFAGRYIIRRTLGKGGMGVVHLVEDTLLDGEPMALKVLHANLDHDQKNSQRFLREILLTRRISHPNIVRTFEAGKTPEGKLYFTMEYVEGVSLKDRLDKEGRLDVIEAADILRQIFNGLSVIHAENVVHRDLKPGNVFLSVDGVAKIGDFGVAQVEASDLTDYDEIVGSAAYMAPEAWSGRDIAPPSDIYACGILGYQMLTGELPYRAKAPAEMMWKHLQEYPLAPNAVNLAVPDWLSGFIMLLLEKDSSQRPCDATELRDYLLRALEPGHQKLPQPHVGFDMNAWKEREVELGLSESHDVALPDEVNELLSPLVSASGQIRLPDELPSSQPEALSQPVESVKMTASEAPPVAPPVAPVWEVRDTVHEVRKRESFRIWGPIAFEVLIIAVMFCLVMLLFSLPLTSAAQDLAKQLMRVGSSDMLAALGVFSALFHCLMCGVPSLAILSVSFSPSLMLRGWYKHTMSCLGLSLAVAGCLGGAVAWKVYSMQLSTSRIGWPSILEESSKSLMQIGLLFPPVSGYEIAMKNGVVQIHSSATGGWGLQIFLTVLLMTYGFILLQRLLVPAIFRYKTKQRKHQRLICGGGMALLFAFEVLGGLWIPELVGGGLLHNFRCSLGMYSFSVSGYQVLCAAVNWIAVILFCVGAMHEKWSSSTPKPN